MADWTYVMFELGKENENIVPKKIGMVPFCQGKKITRLAEATMVLGLAKRLRQSWSK